MKSSNEASKSSALRIWSKYATVTFAPCRTVPHGLSPGSGCGALAGAGLAFNSPKISFNSVVLPAPLGPSKPILSPRKMVAEKSRTIIFSPNDFDTCVSSATNLPLNPPLATSILTLPCAVRRAACSARSLPRRSMRAWARVRRASTPLRIQTSSCAKSLSARALITASCANCSAFCVKYAAKLPGYDSSLPRSNSTIRVATLSKNERSCVTVMMLPLKSTNNPSNHSMLSKSKWLVGSSSSSTSGCATNACAKATRFFVPPDKSLTMASGFKCRRCRVSLTRCSQFQPSKVSISVCIESKSPTPSQYWAIRLITRSNPARTATKTVASASKIGSWAT